MPNKANEQRILFQEGKFTALIDPASPLEEDLVDPDTGEPRTYSIGEVATMLNIKESTLRYYEKEFPQLSPKKSKKGRRQFHRDDLHIITKIIALKNEGLKLATIRKRLESYLSKVDHDSEYPHATPIESHTITQPAQYTPTLVKQSYLDELKAIHSLLMRGL